MAKPIKGKTEKRCAVCGKVFTVYHCMAETAKYCSRACMDSRKERRSAFSRSMQEASEGLRLAAEGYLEAKKNYDDAWDRHHETPCRDWNELEGKVRQVLGRAERGVIAAAVAFAGGGRNGRSVTERVLISSILKARGKRPLRAAEQMIILLTRERDQARAALERLNAELRAKIDEELKRT